MVIEGHFAGTRARHYTERDREQLRDIYKKSYPFIDLGFASHRQVKDGPIDLQNRLIQIETQLARQTIPEAKLDAIQDAMNRPAQTVNKRDLSLAFDPARA